MHPNVIKDTYDYSCFTCTFKLRSAFNDLMALGYKVQRGEESGGVTLQQRLEEAASESRMFDQLHQSPRGTK